MARAIKTPLYIQFGGNSAQIFCEDTALYQRLAQYFRHCVPPPTLRPPIIVTYHITRVDQMWRLSRADKEVYYGCCADWLLEMFMQDVVMMLIAHNHHHLIFHAGGLAWEKTGLALCGQSGSGKSTLTAWLVASGFDYLTDEVIAISLESLEMSGLPRPIVLKTGSEFVWQHWLSEAMQQDLTPLPNQAIWLDAELLRPKSVQATTIPRLLLFPHYKKETVLDIQPLSKAETAFQLMHFLVNARNLPHQGMKAVTRLAHHTEAYSVTYGDIEDVTAWIRKNVNQSTIA